MTVRQRVNGFTGPAFTRIGATSLRVPYGPFASSFLYPRQRQMMHRLILLLSVCVLAGCGSPEPLVSTERMTVVAAADGLPVPTRGDLVAPDRPALIGPLDTIRIEVFNVPEFTRDVQVDASGRIALPFLGTVEAGGKTAGELALDVERALDARYVRDPEVTVNIVNSVSQVVTVSGQVQTPGLYPVTNQTTLLRAIAAARGTGEFARKEEVVILRTVDGRRMAGLYSLEAIERGLYDDPPIYPNDIVVVGDSPQRRMFRDFLTVAPLLASPLITILQ